MMEYNTVIKNKLYLLTTTWMTPESEGVPKKTDKIKTHTIWLYLYSVQKK